MVKCIKSFPSQSRNTSLGYWRHSNRIWCCMIREWIHTGRMNLEDFVSQMKVNHSTHASYIIIITVFYVIDPSMSVHFTRIRPLPEGSLCTSDSHKKGHPCGHCHWRRLFKRY